MAENENAHSVRLAESLKRNSVENFVMRALQKCGAFIFVLYKNLLTKLI